MQPSYLLDSNFFIEAHRKSYPLDVFPTFWDKLKSLAQSGQIGSIDKVKNEIYQNEDALKHWCERNLPADFFQDSTIAISEYAEVVRWAYSKLNQPYSQPAIDIFMDAEEADAFLLAFALKHKIALVTNEAPAPDSKKSVKLPDACHPFGIRWLSPVQMLRELNAII